MVLFQTGPFWTLLLGLLINKEPILKIEYVAMVICFCGVIAISTSKADQQVTSDYPKSVGVMLGFLTAWLGATTNVLNRKLKDIHFTVIGFWHPATGLAMSLIYLVANFLMTGDLYFETHSGLTYVFMFTACLIDFVGLNLYNIAY